MKLIKRFHNRYGYTIENWYDKTSDCSRILVRYPNKFELWIHSGYRSDKLAYPCVYTFDDIVIRLKNKTARRYFLREARKLKAYPKLLLQDFLKPGGDRLDQNKINQYDKLNYEYKKI